MIGKIIILVLLGTSATAQTVVATRTIPAHAILTETDIAVSAHSIAGALRDPVMAIGMETRVALFAGRPVRPRDLGQPAVIDRNQIIALHYVSNGLRITTEGRALERAGVGDRARVMNLSSRTTVIATIANDGAGYVR